MALTEEEKNNIKAMVLIEIEKMFTAITNKNNTTENHEKMLYLFDIESKIKRPLMEADT